MGLGEQCQVLAVCPWKTDPVPIVLLLGWPRAGLDGRRKSHPS